MKIPNEYFTEEIKKKQKTLGSRKKRLIKNATSSELKIKELLEELKIRSIFQKGFIKGNYYCIVDFYIPKLKLCIEVDGEYHNNPEQVKRDK